MKIGQHIDGLRGIHLTPVNGLEIVFGLALIRLTV